MRDPAEPLRGSPGVNLFGLLDAPSGVGEGARAAKRALESVGIPHVAINLRKEHLFNGLPLPDFAAPFQVNLFHLNADVLDFAIRAVGTDLLRQRVNLAHWAWELDTFPADWDHLFGTLDEIWVCSEFVNAAVSKRASVPVTTVPYPITPPDDLIQDRAEFGIPEERPVILCAFDMASYPERKNPWACVQAFSAVREHPRRPLLVLKVGAAEVQPEVLRQLRERVSAEDTILIHSCLDRHATWRLINSCDVFLSLHRAEGFGLLLAEAMSLGKCVVATGYSGNCDFMHSENSFPVKYTMQTLMSDLGPYRMGNHWADPDIPDAVRQLRVILDSPSAARVIAGRAEHDIRENLHAARVGELIQQRLKKHGIGTTE